MNTANCEPERGLWSKECAASQKHSWEYPEFQQMIHGSHSPGQQFSLVIVEAEDGWSIFPLVQIWSTHPTEVASMPRLWDDMIFHYLRARSKCIANKPAFTAISIVVVKKEFCPLSESVQLAEERPATAESLLDKLSKHVAHILGGRGGGWDDQAICWHQGGIIETGENSLKRPVWVFNLLLAFTYQQKVKISRTEFQTPSPLVLSVRQLYPPPWRVEKDATHSASSPAADPNDQKW